MIADGWFDASGHYGDESLMTKVLSIQALMVKPVTAAFGWLWVVREPQVRSQMQVGGADLVWR